METIGEQKIWTFFPGSTKAVVAKNCTAIRKAEAHRVANYPELASKLAELQFMNREHVLMMRGQSGDHRNVAGNTSLKPTIMRGSAAMPNPDDTTLAARYRRLEAAEAALAEGYEARKFLGVDRIERQRILRWAILQHYEICRTPLLDVTHSLRIAASFACDGGSDDGYVFVLGVPNVSGAVTASAEAGLQIVRLSSVCPPTAVRPHIQEGFLLGIYPDLEGTDQQARYGHYEIDFGRRLVAKFVFDKATFWANSPNFPMIAQAARYPGIDPMQDLAATVVAALPPDV